MEEQTKQRKDSTSIFEIEDTHVPFDELISELRY